MTERVHYGDEIRGRLGKYALDALRTLDTMFESAFSPSKNKEPSKNDIFWQKGHFHLQRRKNLLEKTFLRKICQTSQLLAEFNKCCLVWVWTDF